MNSPLHYMGNKSKLIDDLKFYFPEDNECDTFIDLFGGSGCVSINVNYKNIIYNEINNNVVKLLNIFKDYDSEEIIKHIHKRIKEYDLPYESCDIRVKHYTEEKKDKGQNAYNMFREFYNKSDKNILDLYTLTFFSFCNLIRFNSKDEFNMPFGNRCFLKENEQDIINACYIFKNKNIYLNNKDAFEILNSIQTYSPNVYIYLDPPYSNTMAIYNENRAYGGWGIEDDTRLFDELDRVTKLGVKWSLSNVLENKDKTNEHIEQWAMKNNYKIIELDRNYAALGKGVANSKEVLILNYQPKFEQTNIFEFMEE